MTDTTHFEDQEAKREEAAHRNRIAAQTKIDDLRWLMGSKRGRRIVHCLLSDAGVFRLSFHTNAMQMAFNEGNRNMGNSLLALVTEHCPDLYVALLTEAKGK